MKKILTVLLAGLTTTLCAQTTLTPKFGVSVYDFKSDNQENVSNVVGITGGVSLSLTLSETLSLQPELVYIQKGASYKFEEPIGDGILETREIDLKVNYLELPVLIKATFGPKNYRFFVNGGPTFSYGLGGKTSYSLRWTFGDEIVLDESAEGDVNWGDYPEESEVQEVYFKNRFDVGAQFGGGITFFNKVSLDVRYTIHFIKLDDEAQPQNRGLQVTVGMPISIF